jgi:hypothetical protein
MARRAALPVSLLAAICSMLWSAPCRAQYPQSPKPCSVPSVSEDEATSRKVIVDSIQFDGPIHLSDSDVAQVVAESNRSELNPDDSGWSEDLIQIGLRGAWQDRGYFRVMVTGEVQSLGGDSLEERFLVKVHVNEGPQYHLGDLRFTSSAPDDLIAFSESELRSAFPLREGELFNVGVVRKGIEELTQLYGSQGYIDFTVVPDTEIDDHLQRISLVLVLDQQKQFRIRNMDVVGLAAELEALLKSKLKPGDVFNPTVAMDFFEENKAALPPGLSPNKLQVRRNARNGTVDLLFNFLPLGVVEGIVLDSSSQPVANASVYYHIGDDLSRGASDQTTTDCNGHFVLSDVLAGSVRIRASKESDGYMDRRIADPFYGQMNDGEFPEIQVNAGETVKGVVVHLGFQGAILELKAFDVDTKAPLDGLAYRLCRGDPASGNQDCLSGVTSGRGEAHQIVPADSITVKISSQGYESWNFKDEKTGSSSLTLHSGEMRSLSVFLKRSNPGNER